MVAAQAVNLELTRDDGRELERLINFAEHLLPRKRAGGAPPPEDSRFASDCYFEDDFPAGALQLLGGVSAGRQRPPGTLCDEHGGSLRPGR